MCRVIRNHPIKSIVFLMVLVSCVHLNYKLAIIKSFSQQNTHISETLPLNISDTEVTPRIDYKTDLPLCKVNMVTLKSTITVDQTAYPLKDLQVKPWATNIVEGSWSPTNCTPSHKVAIIIPYRNREEHLKIFLNHMHPFLQKQLLSYGIFLIEQAPGTRFNRAALFNIGYKESFINNVINYDCFIFHDVDLLPSNEKNFYTCDSSPVHLSVAIDKFNYKLPYQSIFGGAVALSRKHLLQVNGFSNIFFGWGGEDDDMSSRLSFQNLNIHRYPNSVARYVMIKHSVDSGNPVNPLRFNLLKTSKDRYVSDGISSLSYEVVSRNRNVSSLYRHVTVQLPEKEMLQKWNL